MSRHHLVLSWPCCFRHPGHCLIAVIALWGRGTATFSSASASTSVASPTFPIAFARAAAACNWQHNTDNCRFCPEVVIFSQEQEASLPPYPSPLQPTWAAQTDAEGGFRRLSANWPDSIHFASFDGGAIQASQSTTVNCKTITRFSMFVPDGPGHVQRGYSDLRVQIHTQAGQPIGQCKQMTLSFAALSSPHATP